MKFGHKPGPRAKPTQAAMSVEAWRAFDPKSIDGKICAFLSFVGNFGAISSEIEEALEARHQTISAQLTHLRERGLIRATERHRYTPSGRRATVYVLREQSREQQPDLFTKEVG